MVPASSAVGGRWSRLVAEHRRRQAEELDIVKVRPRLGFAAVAAAVLGAAVASGVAMKGADNWCASAGLARGGYSSKELGVNAWPPGIRCSFRASDGTDVNLVIPYGD